MKTMTAFWRYDWALNWPRHAVLAAVVTAWPWAMMAARGGMDAGQPWAAFLFVGVLLGLLSPLLFVGNVIEVGRSASPRAFRHFAHTLPLDRGRWAAAKLATVFVVVGLVPLLLLTVGLFAQRHLMGLPMVSEAPGQPGMLTFSFLAVAAFMVWTMLWAAVLPHRWVLVGMPLFLCGEAFARHVYSFDYLVKRLPHRGLASGLDSVLLVLLTVLLAAVFVRYHQQRRRARTLLVGILVLVGTDGLRALAYGLINGF